MFDNKNHNKFCLIIKILIIKTFLYKNNRDSMFFYRINVTIRSKDSLSTSKTFTSQRLIMRCLLHRPNSRILLAMRRSKIRAIHKNAYVNLEVQRVFRVFVMNRPSTFENGRSHWSILEFILVLQIDKFSYSSSTLFFLISVINWRRSFLYDFVLYD